MRAKLTVLCNCKRRHQLYSVRHLLKLQEVGFFSFSVYCFCHKHSLHLSHSFWPQFPRVKAKANDPRKSLKGSTLIKQLLHQHYLSIFFWTWKLAKSKREQLQNTPQLIYMSLNNNSRSRTWTQTQVNHEIMSNGAFFALMNRGLN